jgi:hypothetical protein
MDGLRGHYYCEGRGVEQIGPAGRYKGGSMSKINLVELNKREMDKVKGGCDTWVGGPNGSCMCGCFGPSSDYWNGAFNWEGGIHSAGCWANPLQCGPPGA